MVDVVNYVVEQNQVRQMPRARIFAALNSEFSWKYSQKLRT